MREIKLRDFAYMSSLDMIDYTERRVRTKVIDDNNAEIITDTFLLAINWFTLGVHRMFPEEPFLIDEVIKVGKDSKKRFIDDEVINHATNVFLPKIMVKYDNPSFYDLIKQIAYVQHNLIHNYLCVKGESGVVSARSMDLIPVYNNPKIAQLKEERRNNKITTKEAEFVFNQIMLKDETLDNNIFALLYRTGGVNKIQSYQLVIERGKVFDLNGTIMPFNVNDSYADGVTLLADSLADSKGAGFSINTNGAALQDSEWFHKKLHNLAQSVKGVQYQTDCGSTKGMEVEIFSKEFSNSFLGKYQIGKDGINHLITQDNLNDLVKVGEVYKFRSVRYCHLSKNGYPCSKCFGKMESALPYNPYTGRGAVPGLFYGSTFGESIGQRMLKTKHYIGSALSVKFVVDEIDKDHITTDGNMIFIHKDLLNEDADPFIILDKNTTVDFADYRAMEDIYDIDSNHLPTYESIMVKYNTVNPMTGKMGAISTKNIKTFVESRKARMTKDFIAFLKDKEMTIDNKISMISLQGWDSQIPAFELPFINENLDAFRIKAENELKFQHLNGRVDLFYTEREYGKQLEELWKTYNEGYKGANIIIGDIFLWCCSAVNPDGLDYSMPSATQESVFVNMHDCVLNRGQGNMLNYGYQSRGLMGSHLNFLTVNRQGGVLESAIQPIAIK